MLGEFGVQKADELFAAIGYGKLPARNGAARGSCRRTS